MRSGIDRAVGAHTPADRPGKGGGVYDSLDAPLQRPLCWRKTGPDACMRLSPSLGASPRGRQGNGRVASSPTPVRILGYREADSSRTGRDPTIRWSPRLPRDRACASRERSGLRGNYAVSLTGNGLSTRWRVDSQWWREMKPRMAMGLASAWMSQIEQGGTDRAVANRICGGNAPPIPRAVASIAIAGMRPLLPGRQVTGQRRCAWAGGV